MIRIRYDNHGSFEQVLIERFEEENNYHRGYEQIAEVRGYRPNQYDYGSNDDAFAAIARNLYERFRDQYGRPDESYIVPGALYGEVAEAVWKRPDSDRAIVEEVIGAVSTSTTTERGEA